MRRCLPVLLLAACAAQAQVAPAVPAAAAAASSPAGVASMSSAFTEPPPAPPRDDPEMASQREAIRSGREAAEARFMQAQKACYQKFAVNDCLARARAERREVLSDLHRQEVALNDELRKRKAAERQRSLEQRDDERQQRLDGDPTGHAAQDATRQQQAREHAADQAAMAASAPGRAAQREAEVARRQAEVAENRRRAASESAQRVADQEKKLQQAKQRERERQERLAGQSKPPAPPLPVPP